SETDLIVNLRRPLAESSCACFNSESCTTVNAPRYRVQVVDRNGKRESVIRWGTTRSPETESYPAPPVIRHPPNPSLQSARHTRKRRSSVPPPASRRTSRVCPAFPGNRRWQIL